MIRNFINIFINITLRDKSLSIANLAGLTVGIFCFLILGIYSSVLLSFDKHHTNHEQVYRIAQELTLANGITSPYALTAEPLGSMLKENYPAIEEYTRFIPYISRTRPYQYGDVVLYWDKVYESDTSTFGMFTHEVIYGDPATALDEPSSIAVSRKFAESYFGDSNPIGEIVTRENDSLTVTLVFEDLPENSHLKYDVLHHLPDRDVGNITLQDNLIGRLGVFTYIKVGEGSDQFEVQETLESFYRSFMKERADEGNRSVKFEAERLDKIHFTSATIRDLPRGNIIEAYMILLVGIVILLMAAVNYVNLTIANASYRSKEIAIRSSVGASNMHLTIQLVFESLFFVGISGLVAFYFLMLASNIHALEQVLGMGDTFLSESPMRIGAFIFIVVAPLGIMTGLYVSTVLLKKPFAFIVSNNENSFRERILSIRNISAVFQVSATTFVLIASIHMYWQLEYMKNKDLGIEKEDVIFFPVFGADQIESLSQIKDQLSQYDVVENQSISKNIPEMELGNTLLTNSRIELNESQSMDVVSMRVGEGFVSTMGIELLEGSDFDREAHSVLSNKIIINEALYSILKDAEGGSLRAVNVRGEIKEVIGVVQDFHYREVSSPIEPLILQFYDMDFSEMSEGRRSNENAFLVVKSMPGRTSETIRLIEEMWFDFDNIHPLQISYLDTYLNSFYTSNRSQLILMFCAALISSIISVIGLFALTTFIVAKSRKVLAIHRVLGATDTQIFFSIVRKLAPTILVALVLGWIFSFLMISEWLSLFAYTIKSGMEAYQVATLVVIVTTLTIVLVQSRKVFSRSPSEFLR